MTLKKGTDIPIHAMKANKGSGGTAPNILNLCTRGVELSAAWPSQCTMRGKCTPPQKPLTRRLGGSPRASLDILEKRETSYCCQELNPQTVGPIAQLFCIILLQNLF